MPSPEGSKRPRGIRPHEAVPEDALRDSAGKAENAVLSPQAKLQRAIQLRRQDTQMSIEDVAERLGTTPQYISDIETGKVDPTFSYLVKIANAMGAVPEISFTPREEQSEQEMTGHDTTAPETPNHA
jgi:ribosome-binding protein aMBF1 (putative translation factor)